MAVPTLMTRSGAAAEQATAVAWHGKGGWTGNIEHIIFFPRAGATA